MVQDYYDHVKYPMDLKTMTDRLKSNYYCNKRLFVADMKRMFSNPIMSKSEWEDFTRLIETLDNTEVDEQTYWATPKDPPLFLLHCCE